MNLEDIWCPNCMRYHASVTCCPTPISSPMPQNNPMTPEAFAKLLARVAFTVDEFGERDTNAARLIINQRDAQLIRSTLEAAAERVCIACLNGETKGCPLAPDMCGDKRAILAPLTKPDEIECATLDEVNHRRGSGA